MGFFLSVQRDRSDTIGVEEWSLPALDMDGGIKRDVG